jgi:YegS/Rv2252/BmrU family lipid kinase
MTNQKKILFIVNPISGTGKQKNIESLVNLHLDKTKFISTLKFTKYAGHAKEIVKNEHPNFDIIVAVGGDGTVHEVGTSLINTDCILGIIPTGSGNGLARHLKIPMKVKDAVKHLNNYKVKRIDTVLLNNQPFLGAAGFGFDAHVAWKFDEAPTRGLLTYLKISVQEYFSYKPQEYKLIFKDKTVETTDFLITISNSNQYGNNAYISPNSVLDDGYIRLIGLKYFPLYIAPLLALKLFNKKILTSKYVTEYKTDYVEIQSPRPEMHMDGEPVKHHDNIKIEVNPKSLNVISNE